ncbi:MarR family winged helix-turn-helix transcriptional regulator [Coprothermobacter platensis]|uniref:MarR family winged helix-turn-helix transcriptional regulator n=1 Tax=Coprothermobacter platensis TaxID=108819 RepID=UPI00035F178F|nr:MarR family transcriptional regulator [Coprothermobacter platensis]
MADEDTLGMCLNEEDEKNLSLEVFRSLFRLIRSHGQLLFKMTSEQGFYPGQAVALLMINRTPGISQHELAEVMHVAPPTAAHILKKLEKSGFISKTVNMKDQRSVHIQLTQDGVEAVKTVTNIFKDIVKVSLDGLNEQQKNELVELLNMVTSNMCQRMKSLGGTTVDDRTIH